MNLRSFCFFQAEDGIRDGHVTGVQTCALPISMLLRGSRVPTAVTCANDVTAVGVLSAAREYGYSVRSEERRVGKEWLTGWSADLDGLIMKRGGRMPLEMGS